MDREIPKEVRDKSSQCALWGNISTGVKSSAR